MVRIQGEGATKLAFLAQSKMITMRTKFNIKATIFDKKGRILAIGYNDYNKTHPLMKMYACKCSLPHKEFLHAEVAAILKCKNKKPYKIKIERYDKKGNPANAKPCPICEMVIKIAGIKIIEYTL